MSLDVFSRNMASWLRVPGQAGDKGLHRPRNLIMAFFNHYIHVLLKKANPVIYNMLYKILSESNVCAHYQR